MPLYEYISESYKNARGYIFKHTYGSHSVWFLSLMAYHPS